MLSTESTIVRAFTKRRATNPVSPPPPPPSTQEAFQRRQAALRQMGLLPVLSLSQQEAQLDSFIPTSPLDDPMSDSEADMIKNDWVAKNNSPPVENERFQSFKFGGTPLPSPPLTPLSALFAGTDLADHPESMTIEPTLIEKTENQTSTSEPTPLTATTMSNTTTTSPVSDSDSDSSAPLTPQSERPSFPSNTTTTATTKPSNITIPPVNLIPSDSLILDVILEDQEHQPTLVQFPADKPRQPHSPISPEFHPPDSPHSPAHLQPPGVEDSIPSSFRSRSPSLAGSESKSTKSSRSRSRSKTRARSPLRFFTRAKEAEEPLPPLPASPTTEEAKTVTPPQDAKVEPPNDPPPQPPQRKKTVFSRFKRANTLNPSSVSSPTSQSGQKEPRAQTPSRSKSLFTSVKKTVFGLSANPSGGGGVTTTPALPSSPTIATSNPNLALPTSVSVSIPSVDSAPPASTTTTATAAPAKHSDSDASQPKADVVLEEVTVKAEDEPTVPFESSAEAPSGQEGILGKVEFPTTSDDSQESDSNLDHDRERSPSLCTTNVSVNTPSTRKGTGKGIGMGISLILNRERTKSSSPLPSSPPASPLSSTFLSPPASPTSFSMHGGRLRGRLGRKGTIGSGTDGLLSVWGGVTGLLGGAPSIVTNGSGSCSEDGADGEVRQALAPTIHNEASISHHMSNIEDEETRRVTELAFM